MKHSSSHSSGTHCPPASKRWADFDEDEFQPYQHSHLPPFHPYERDYCNPERVYPFFFRSKCEGGITVYTCKLCNVDISPQHAFASAFEELKEHSRSPPHVARAEHVRTLKSLDVTDECFELQLRMDKLPPAPWQEELRGRMFTVLIDDKFYTEGLVVENIVEGKERNESLTLLALAVWKSLCLVEKSMADVQTWNAWTKDGWKESKGSWQDANEIGVIAQLVRPFLIFHIEEPYELDDDSDNFFPSKHICRYLTDEVAFDREFATFSCIKHRYRCEICDENLMDFDGIKSHSRGKKHKKRVQQIRQLQDDPIKAWCAHVNNRIDQSTPSPWTHQVKSKLFWVLLGYRVWNQVQTDARMKEVEMLLYTDEQYEKLHLVRLLAWKSLCLLTPPPKADQNEIDFCFWADWTRDGWKCHKSAMRDSVDIDSLVQRISPFVGPDSGPD